MKNYSNRMEFTPNCTICKTFNPHPENLPRNIHKLMEEEKLLGKSIAYPKTYCPDILVAVPRHLNREIYQIDPATSFFYGYDSWHCYEASFLTSNGLPVSGILKLVYPAESEYLVESKSLKLYLGSFQMYRLEDTVEESISLFCRKVAEDLGKCLHTSVGIHFYSNSPANLPFDFSDYEILENLPGISQCIFADYQENPVFLKENCSLSPGEIKVGSHLLKSNCKITRQPDWGSIYIRMKASSLPDRFSLLKYIVSLRDENHFHEEVCEMVFKRLTDFFHPEILSVGCLYTRRGGIDICPVRANRPEYLPLYLPCPDILTQKEFRQ